LQNLLNPINSINLINSMNPINSIDLLNSQKIGDFLHEANRTIYFIG
jgi:hypothetical protein